MAADLLAPADVDEARVRLAVSTMYYGLFHHLTAAASAVFDGGGPPRSALTATLVQAEAQALLEQAKIAHQHLRALEHHPETRTFLTPLLVADRWTRRG